MTEEAPSNITGVFMLVRKREKCIPGASGSRRDPEAPKLCNSLEKIEWFPPCRAVPACTRKVEHSEASRVEMTLGTAGRAICLGLFGCQADSRVIGKVRD